MDKIRALAICIMLLFWVMPVLAKEHVVTEKGMAFSELFLKIEHDDVVKFVNKDTVNHKLVFSHHSLESIETVLAPGESQTIVFSKPGVYDITCNIHPNMKMTVFVPHVDVVLN